MAKRIGLVVRDPRLRAELAGLFRKAGAEVREGELSADAFNWVADGLCDLLVLDLHLEDVHGDDVLGELRRDGHTGLPVIMLIEEEDTWFVERAERAGADVVLPYARWREVPRAAAGLLRIDARFATEGRVGYYIVDSSERRIFSAQLVDVSRSGGAMLARQCELEPGFAIDLRIELPGLEGPILVRGEVVRVVVSSEGYRVAVRWRKFRQGDAARFEAWLRQAVRNRKRTATL